MRMKEGMGKKQQQNKANQNLKMKIESIKNFFELREF